MAHIEGWGAGTIDELFGTRSANSAIAILLPTKAAQRLLQMGELEQSVCDRLPGYGCGIEPAFT